jgi:Rod binding domain-containing protein
VVANKVEDLYDARVSDRDTALEAFARDLEAIFHQYLAFEEQD